MKAIYFEPYFDFENHDNLEQMSDDELYNLALENNVKIYNSPRDFSMAFNNGYISDEGYVFFVGGDDVLSRLDAIESLLRDRLPFRYPNVHEKEENDE